MALISNMLNRINKKEEKEKKPKKRAYPKDFEFKGIHRQVVPQGHKKRYPKIK